MIPVEENVTFQFHRSLVLVLSILADPKPIMDAVRLNSPHYLCQMIISESGCQKYTLVVAQVCIFLTIVSFSYECKING